VSDYESALDEAVSTSIEDFIEDVPVDDDDTSQEQDESVEGEVSEDEGVEGSEEDDSEQEEDDESQSDEDDEDSDDDDSEEDDEDDSETEEVELSEDLEIELPDGTSATLKELREGHLRQADYTKKTQALAEERKKFEAESTKSQETLENVQAWYETRDANKPAWIMEIADQSGDSLRALTDAIGMADDPSSMVAYALHNLAKEGRLDDQLVEHFGLTKVAGTVGQFAKGAQANDQVSRLQREIDELKAAREGETTEAQVASIRAEYESQWTSVKGDDGFADDIQARRSVMEFAQEHEIPNLQVAYEAMVTRGQAPKRAGDTSREEARQAVKAKKKKTKAVTRNTKQRGGSQRSAKAKTLSADDAVREVFSEQGWDTSDL